MPRAHAVILAGGRGTRFWPRSRTLTPKQLLNIVGSETMLEQTRSRLAPMFPAARVWVVTNKDQAAAVRKIVPQIAQRNILAEPVGRNTAAAIALAAIHLQHREGGDALMAVLPADHFIAQPAHYRKIVRAALKVAAEPGALVVLGVPPTRPETGYGYIERGASARRVNGAPVFAVRKFTEKPALPLARRYVASRRYFWNAGMFFWRVSTYLENLARQLPKMHAALLRLAETIGTPRYEAALRRTYPQLENISVDYAILEPASRDPRRSPVFVLPAAVGWSDIGSWAAVYDLMVSAAGKRKQIGQDPVENVSASRLLAIDAAGNFFWSPKKFVAAIGVRDLVVVETPDALLICPRERSQDVGQVVKWLEAHKLGELL
jgi:mannose-1-phosphate guanylyltransferase